MPQIQQTLSAESLNEMAALVEDTFDVNLGLLTWRKSPASRPQVILIGHSSVNVHSIGTLIVFFEPDRVAASTMNRRPATKAGITSPRMSRV